MFHHLEFSTKMLLRHFSGNVAKGNFFILKVQGMNSLILLFLFFCFFFGGGVFAERWHRIND